MLSSPNGTPSKTQARERESAKEMKKVTCNKNEKKYEEMKETKKNSKSEEEKIAYTKTNG